MPSFARELEQTLHNALGEASRRRHEYATLEHLLIALIDDEHASKVMIACGVSKAESSNRAIFARASSAEGTQPLFPGLQAVCPGDEIANIVRAMARADRKVVRIMPIPIL